jgi:hypothetical protein
LRRRLTIVEIEEAKPIFETSLDFDRIWVHEDVGFPNWIGRIGATITGRKPPGNNAITIGNHIYFPVQLEITREGISINDLKDMGWLIHELTHVWQFQNTGIGYLFEAILSHIRLGAKVYDYGAETGLRQAAEGGKGIAAFNPEQQGDIVRKIYQARKVGKLTPTLSVIAEQIKEG